MDKFMKLLEKETFNDSILPYVHAINLGGKLADISISDNNENSVIFMVDFSNNTDSLNDISREEKLEKVLKDLINISDNISGCDLDGCILCKESDKFIAAAKILLEK